MQQLEINKPKKDSGLSLKINDAIRSELKIVNANDQEIREALIYCFALTGLQDQYIPKGLTRNFLIEFVRENFKFYSVEEIKTAFTMAVKGELDVANRTGETIKVAKHYNNFSPEFFGSVMAVYKTHREKAFLELHLASNKQKEDVPYLPNGIEKIKIQQEFDLSVVKPAFDRYVLNKHINLLTSPPKLVYDSLSCYHKIIEFTNEEKQAIKIEATENLRIRTEELKTFKSSSYSEHKDKMKLMSIMSIDIDNNNVISECYLICIKKCFDKMIETGFKF